MTVRIKKKLVSLALLLSSLLLLFEVIKIKIEKLVSLTLLLYSVYGNSFSKFSRLRGRGISKKSTFFKESPPRSRTYELCDQEKKKEMNKIKTKNTSHCPTKTISKTDPPPLKIEKNLVSLNNCVTLF